jgi:hypothetical protein
MSEKTKRQLKRRMQNTRSFKPGEKFGLTVFAITLVLFCISQIIINSMLSPLGAELKAYNIEKQALLEENQQLEEKLAETQSLTIIENVTEKKLGLADDGARKVIYVSDQSIRAEK